MDDAPGEGRVAGPGGTDRAPTGRVGLALLVSAFVVATCGLIYELLAGTLASYLLGDSVTQFSIVIGTYLCSPWAIGSWCSRYIREEGRDCRCSYASKS